MSFLTLKNTLAGILKGTDIIPVISEFNENSVYGRDNIFATVGVKDIKAICDFSDKSAINRFQFCKVFYNITISGAYTDGDSLVEIAEGMYLKLFSSTLNIDSISGGGISFNTKLNRLEYSFVAVLNTMVNGNAVSSIKQNKIIYLNENISFYIDSYEFEKLRNLLELPTICGGNCVCDAGQKPLALKLCGDVFSQNGDILVALDNIITNGTLMDLSCLGLDLPAMKLKKYIFSGNKNSVSSHCELLLWGENPLEVIDFE